MVAAVERGAIRILVRSASVSLSAAKKLSMGAPFAGRARRNSFSVTLAPLPTSFRLRKPELHLCPSPLSLISRKVACPGRRARDRAPVAPQSGRRSLCQAHPYRWRWNSQDGAANRRDLAQPAASHQLIGSPWPLGLSLRRCRDRTPPPASHPGGGGILVARG